MQAHKPGSACLLCQTLRANPTASTRCSATAAAHHAEIQKVPDHVSGILSINYGVISFSTGCTVPRGHVLAVPLCCGMAGDGSSGGNG